MKATRVVFIVLLLSIGCKNGDGKHVIKKEYYPSGKIMSEISYLINDTIKDGSAIDYFSNGQIMGKSYYSNDYQNGLVTGYYKNGQLKYKFFSVDGHRHGTDTNYYESGIIEDIGIYWHGKGLGSFYYYYPSGKIEAYNARDNTDSSFMIEDFDISGNRTDISGHIVSRHVSTTDDIDKHYTTSDTLTLAFPIAEPPDFRTQVKIGLYKMEGDKRTLIDTFKEYPHDQWNKWHHAVYLHKFSAAGNYMVACMGQMYDTLYKSYTNWDTVFIDHTVYER
jgi:hypothetical protein